MHAPSIQNSRPIYSHRAPEEGDIFSLLPPDAQRLMGQFLALPDLLRYGQTSKRLYEVAGGVLQMGEYVIETKASKLAGATERLAKIHSLHLIAMLATDAEMANVGQLTNLLSLDIGGGADISSVGLSHLENLPKLRFLDLTCADMSDVELTG